MPNRLPRDSNGPNHRPACLTHRETDPQPPSHPFVSPIRTVALPSVVLIYCRYSTNQIRMRFMYVTPQPPQYPAIDMSLAPSGLQQGCPWMLPTFCTARHPGSGAGAVAEVCTVHTWVGQVVTEHRQSLACCSGCFGVKMSGHAD